MTDENVNQNNSGNENAGADGNENAEIKFTAEQQKKIDELISQRLKAVNDKHSKELQELNSKHKLDLDEVEKKAKMTAEQLKQHEEDKLKADMMNCPRRWEQVTVEQVRAKCRALKMRPKDVDTITGYLQRRKEGRRFNVRSSYRTFRFS